MISVKRCVALRVIPDNSPDVEDSIDETDVQVEEETDCLWIENGMSERRRARPRGGESKQRLTFAKGHCERPDHSHQYDILARHLLLLDFTGTLEIRVAGQLPKPSGSAHEDVGGGGLGKGEDEDDQGES